MTTTTPEPLNLLEEAWGLIANAGGGVWTRESKDWQEAAVRFRERYHQILVVHSRGPEDKPVPPPPLAGEKKAPLHHAAVIYLRGRVYKARAFGSRELARVFAEGVSAGATAMDDPGTVRTFLLDERGSLAVTNEGLAAAKAAGWERATDA